jgi:hypothetical protein
VASQVGAEEIATGEQILSGTSPFPVLSAGYASYGSFARYASSMRSLGARFVVLSEREIAAGVDLERASLEKLGSLEGFSPRARSYSGEPELDRVMKLVRERYGPSASIAMLVPRALDAGLFGGIAGVLEQHGQPAHSVHEVLGRYEPAADGSTRLRVDAALRKDGERIPLDVIFDLDQIASVSRGSASDGGAT